jgi:hypothetical protein
MTCRAWEEEKEDDDDDDDNYDYDELPSEQRSSRYDK